MPGCPVLSLRGSSGYCATGTKILLWIVSTAMVDPPRPEHATPASVPVGALAVPATKTPITGKTKALPGFVHGHAPVSLVFEPDPEYQRRVPGLKPIMSSRFTWGKRASTVPSLRLTMASPATLLHPTTIVFVTGSIQLPLPEQFVMG